MTKRTADAQTEALPCGWYWGRGEKIWGKGIGAWEPWLLEELPIGDGKGRNWTERAWSRWSGEEVQDRGPVVLGPRIAPPRLRRR